MEVTGRGRVSSAGPLAGHTVAGVRVPARVVEFALRGMEAKERGNVLSVDVAQGSHSVGWSCPLHLFVVCV